ncbi:MAG: hypothetical protein ABSC21_00830 [Terriglobia bacterium]|jgi:hypothetical protein
MPGERSLYRKIQSVLDVSKSVKVETVQDLAKEVWARGLPNFMTKQYDRKSDRFVTRTSAKAVRRTVSFCLMLGLIDSDGSLTRSGREAIRRPHFESVVAGQVREYFARAGVTIGAVNSEIVRMMHASPFVPPTGRTIWEEVKPNIRYPVFHRMLTLLAHCGGANSSQRKIYLEIYEK